jgi:hypothetical protein
MSPRADAVADNRHAFDAQLFEVQHRATAQIVDQAYVMLLRQRRQLRHARAAGMVTGGVIVRLD